MNIHPERPETSAVIITYKPDLRQLQSLIATLAAQCTWVFVMDNGGASPIVGNSEYLPLNVRYVDMCGNKGVGAALNRGFELAAGCGSTYVISFDQDSAPGPDMIARLVGVHEQLQAKGVKVAAVGPRFVDHRGGTVIEYPFMRLKSGWPRAVRCGDSSRLVESDLLITSGCLVSLAAYRGIGPFDAGMYVDMTDVEWCFRATFRGFRLYGVCCVTMSHEVGLGKLRTVFGVALLSYSPVRRYYAARNSVHLLRSPYVRRMWKVRMLGGLIARWILLPLAPESGHGRLSEWRMFSKGIWEGLRSVSGPEARHDQ